MTLHQDSGFPPEHSKYRALATIGASLKTLLGIGLAGGELQRCKRSGRRRSAKLHFGFYEP